MGVGFRGLVFELKSFGVLGLGCREGFRVPIGGL